MPKFRLVSLERSDESFIKRRHAAVPPSDPGRFIDLGQQSCSCGLALLEFD